MSIIQFYLRKYRTAEILVAISFFCFGLFPVLPNQLKGLPVVLLLVFSIILAVKDKSFTKIKKSELLLITIFSGLYIMYAVSLLYSEDIKTGLRRMETCASLIVIPFSFLLLKTSVNYKPYFILFSKVFFWSTTVFSLLINLYFFQLGYYSGEMSLYESLSWMDHEMWLFKQHAIYASMFISIGLILSKFIINIQSVFNKVVIILAIIINTYVLFLLLRKGVIIALLVSLLIFVFWKFKTSKLKVILPLLSVLLIAGMVFKEPVFKRLEEVWNPETYKNLDIDNSTSMRFAIYKCVFEDIKQSPVIGHGVGDGYDLIASCLKDNYEVVFTDTKEKKNSHNQFFGILLYTGILGLSIFLVQLFIYFSRSIKIKDSIMLEFLAFFTVLFFVENLLDRQSGVIMFTFLVNAYYFSRDSSKKMTGNG